MVNVEEVPSPDHLQPTPNSIQKTRQMDTHWTSSPLAMESHSLYQDTEYLHLAFSWVHAILPNPPQTSIQTPAAGLQWWSPSTAPSMLNLFKHEAICLHACCPNLEDHEHSKNMSFNLIHGNIPSSSMLY